MKFASDNFNRVSGEAYVMIGDMIVSSSLFFTD